MVCDALNVPGKFLKPSGILMRQSHSLRHERRTAFVIFSVFRHSLTRRLQERAFAEWFVCTLCLHFAVVNVMG
jgi:hypothetical protein